MFRRESGLKHFKYDLSGHQSLIARYENLHYAIFGDLILHPGMDHLGSFGPECLNGDILANAFTYAALARNLHMRVDRSIHATSLANGFLTLALQCVALIR